MTGEFFQIKYVWNGAKHRQHLVQFAFQQTLGDEFTFQQGNNLKHEAFLVSNYSVDMALCFILFPC